MTNTTKAHDEGFRRGYQAALADIRTAMQGRGTPADAAFAASEWVRGNLVGAAEMDRADLEAAEAAWEHRTESSNR